MKLREGNHLNKEDLLSGKKGELSESALTVKVKDRVICGFLGNLARPTPPILRKIYNQISNYYDEQQKARKAKKMKSRNKRKF